MHPGLTESTVRCPFCGEAVTILIDTSAGDQSYVEDCQVCCRPMNIDFSCAGGELSELRVSGDT